MDLQTFNHKFSYSLHVSKIYLQVYLEHEIFLLAFSHFIVKNDITVLSCSLKNKPKKVVQSLGLLSVWHPDPFSAPYMNRCDSPLKEFRQILAADVKQSVLPLMHLVKASNTNKEQRGSSFSAGGLCITVMDNQQALT